MRLLALPDDQSPVGPTPETTEDIEYLAFKPKTCGLCGQSSADHLDELIEMAMTHLDSISEGVLDPLRDFEIILRRADGRTVMVPEFLVRLASGTAEMAWNSDYSGDAPWASSIHHLPKTFRWSVEFATIRAHWEMTPARWQDTDLDGVIEYDTGTLHAVRDGQLHCASTAVDDEAVRQNVNLAHIFGTYDVCGTCEAAFITLIERHGASARQLRDYVREHYDTE